jgi:hypothetical protein
VFRVLCVGLWAEFPVPLGRTGAVSGHCLPPTPGTLVNVHVQDTGTSDEGQAVHFLPSLLPLSSLTPPQIPESHVQNVPAFPLRFSFRFTPVPEPCE